MRTTENPKYIRSTDGSFPNLQEEIKDISSKITSRDGDVDQLKVGVTGLNSEIERIDETYSLEISTIKNELSGIESSIGTVQEVVEARGEHETLDGRLDAIESLSIFRENLKLSTEREYRYDANGNVTAEIISGDINYRIDYVYDADGNIISEEHSHNGVLVGRKIYEYHPTLGYIARVVSDKADHMELVYNDTTTRELSNRLAQIESLDVAEQLDKIQSSILIGPYDGARLKNIVESFDTRLQTLEQLTPDKIENILSTPEILQRIEALEMAMASTKRTDDFIVADNEDYVLSGATTAERLRVIVEGIILNHGEENDYVLLSDGRTLDFKIDLIDGMEIICEYY